MLKVQTPKLALALGEGGRIICPLEEKKTFVSYLFWDVEQWLLFLLDQLGS